MLRLSGFILLLCSGVLFAKQDMAVFAGGNFWYLEADFHRLPGVISTLSGYDGGTYKNPSYEVVRSGTTKHVESVKLIFDDETISYTQLLAYFLRHIDPTSKDGQFCDRGKPYRAVVFYLNDEQKQLATQAIASIEGRFPNTYIDILPSLHFYPAEEKLQNYYKNNPLRYAFYRHQCKRDARLKGIWETT